MLKVFNIELTKLKKIAIFFLFLYCIIIVINILTHNEKYGWDFNAYYHYGKAQAIGLNPYDADALSQYEQQTLMPCPYPPLILDFFRLLTLIDYNVVFYFYFLLKCVSLIIIIYLWRNIFFNKQVDLSFYILCLLAFNSTIYLDLRAGNISILEQFMIWLAFFYYLKKRFILFCAFIIIAAIFKIQPILFLLLLLFAEDKKKYVYLFSSFLIFCTLLLLQYVTSPHNFINFTTNALDTVNESGIINPSSFSLLREILQHLLLRGNDIILLNKISLIFFSILIITIIFLSWPTYIHIKSAKNKDKQRWLIFFTCLVYSLIIPRFKDYSYIILIPSAYFIIKRLTCIRAHHLLFILIVISSQNVTLPGFGLAFSIFWNYYPLIIAYLLWILYLYEIPLICQQDNSANAKISISHRF